MAGGVLPFWVPGHLRYPQGAPGHHLGWTAEEVTFGHSLLMVFYAVVAYFSGIMLDKWSTKPVYATHTLRASWNLADSGSTC